MDTDDLRNWYLALPDSHKQIFLALLSHNLTIHGRGFSHDLPKKSRSRHSKA
jgi:hypothetical protein